MRGVDQELFDIVRNAWAGCPFGADERLTRWCLRRTVTSSHARILIVEDEALLALDLALLIEEMGHSVIGPCQNLQAGLRRAASDDIDFALLDYDLGHGTDSLPIVALLAARAVPFVFVTATPSDEIRSHLPMAVVLAKPISQAALAKVLP